MEIMLLKDVTLEGQNVRLEPLAQAHAQELTVAAADPRIWKWYSTPPLLAAQDVAAMIAEALANKTLGSQLAFAIVDKTSGKAVGGTRYLNIDRGNRRVEIGWTWLGTHYQRTALNTEAKLLLLTHAFETLGCIRVEFKTDSLNEQSRKALERIGAVYEGIHRNHMITTSGRLRHSVYYSIIPEEWVAVKKRLAARLAP